MVHNFIFFLHFCSRALCAWWCRYLEFLCCWTLSFFTIALLELKLNSMLQVWPYCISLLFCEHLYTALFCLQEESAFHGVLPVLLQELQSDRRRKLHQETSQWVFTLFLWFSVLLQLGMTLKTDLCKTQNTECTVWGMSLLKCTTTISTSKAVLGWFQHWFSCTA